MIFPLFELSITKSKFNNSLVPILSTAYSTFLLTPSLGLLIRYIKYINIHIVINI